MTKTPDIQGCWNVDEPDIDLLKTLLDSTDPKTFEDSITQEAVKHKYLSLLYNPTVIEKTMTPEQLFTAGHPLWAKPYTINELDFALRNMNDCTCYEELEDLISSYSDMLRYLHHETEGNIKWT